MKQLLNIVAALLLMFSATAQSKVKMPSKFEVAVSFGSMASGPESDVFLKNYVKVFSKKNKVTIPAYKASGCGREGEFYILFSVAKLKSTLRKKFIKEVNTLVAKQQAKNKAADPNSGDIRLDYNKELADYSYCRNGIAKW